MGSDHYELEERCKSECPFETDWSRGAKQASWVLKALRVRTRCTLRKGHIGPHHGPDDSEWEEGEG